MSQYTRSHAGGRFLDTRELWGDPFATSISGSCDREYEHLSRLMPLLAGAAGIAVELVVALGMAIAVIGLPVLLVCWELGF